MLSQRLCLVLMLAAVLLLDGEVLASTWKRIVYKDGITVMEREAPGRDFPTFRGICTVKASIYDVVAVLSDIKRHKEWMHRVGASWLLKEESRRHHIIYMRIDSPWPISDRDAVYRATTTFQRDNKALQQVTIAFRAIIYGRMGTISGVVRMERLRGHYKLKALDSARTRVDYQVDADPGGWLPGWLAKLATRKLPLNTLIGLRRQVARTRGWFTKRIKRWKSGKY